MKKFFTLIAAAFALTASAQEGTFYLQNVESGLYMGGANSWGTQGSVTEEGDLSAIAAVEGGYTITGTTLTSGNKTLGMNLYVDTNASQNGNVWTIAPVEGEEGVYTIYGKGKKDNVVDAFEGYVAQSATKGDVTGYILESVPTVTNAAKWRFVTAEERAANIKAGDNVSFLFANPNFTRNHATSAWIVDEGCTNKNLGGGANNNMCAESYHSIFNIHQTVKVPNGIYTVTAQGFYRQDGEDNENLAVFYANDKTSAFPLKTGAENSMSDASASFTQGLYAIDPIEVEVTNGEFTIGVKNEANANLWCIWDNFQVTLKEAAEDADYTVYAKVTADEQSKTFTGQEIKVSTLSGVATVTLPAAQAGPYKMESQKVKVNIDAEGNISMVDGQTIKFTGAEDVVVTVTGVEGTLAEDKVNVTVTGTGDNGKDVKVVYSSDPIIEPTVITWDFSEYTDRLVLADDNKTVEYNGMTMVGNTQAGYANDYVDAASGFHMNGTSSATTRHLVYTPEKDGKVTVTYRSNNATATDRITAIGTEVVKGSDLAALLANEKVLAAGLTDGATLQTIEADLKAGTTYYFYLANGGQSIMKVEFAEGESTAANTVVAAKAVSVAKFIENGQVVIVKNGKKYNMAGQEM